MCFNNKNLGGGGGGGGAVIPALVTDIQVNVYIGNTLSWFSFQN